jgi:diacylglycerol kinase
LNTSIEKLCDLYSTEENDKIKIIKDIAAGAVLVASLFAGIVGVLIFWKYIK